jgi:hypothetical protein
MTEKLLLEDGDYLLLEDGDYLDLEDIPNFYALWLCSSGTVILNTDFRNFVYRSSLDIVNATSGANAVRRLSHLKDGQIVCNMLLQSDVDIIDMGCLGEGISGTVIWCDNGVSPGYLKHLMPAICMGSSTSSPYSDVMSIETTFQQNGEKVDTIV